MKIISQLWTAAFLCFWDHAAKVFLYSEITRKNMLQTMFDLLAAYLNTYLPPLQIVTKTPEDNS